MPVVLVASKEATSVGQGGGQARWKSVEDIGIAVAVTFLIAANEGMAWENQKENVVLI